MKKNRIIYWISTVMAMLLGATSSFFYFTNPYMIEGFHRLGFPDYFRIELGVAKIIGLFVILIPSVPKILKECAYVGFAITFFSGSLAHGLVDGIREGLFPLIPLTALLISYYYFRKLNYEK